MLRILREIENVTVCLHDYAWQDYDSFVSRAAYEGAIRVSENDARRRGPIFLFRVHAEDAQIIKGTAERYCIRISSQQPIPKPIEQQFTELFQSLDLGQVSVNSETIRGKSEEEGLSDKL